MRSSHISLLLVCLLSTPVPAALAFDRAASESMPSPSIRYLRSTLHVHSEVAQCVAAVNQAVKANKRYDRVVHLDRYVIHAEVRRRKTIFSVGKPIPVDATISMKGSARSRGHWTWLPVETRCGIRSGRVVAISIEPRLPKARPTAKQRMRPGANYVHDETGGAVPVV
jgi:hypothetical protein